ncbi:Hydrogenase maturation factor HypC [BD1-7 clade bacterium]|uniref:Hydrogenase maturation factor HypC n=1 Tax=BD1-7 clade bacterium TaxID=2029982 RepID=A0A5S9QLZ5_9GAMM|nr:Hydrogenase maturation factor HypC [BD1-7 clade bacterium]
MCLAIPGKLQAIHRQGEQSVGVVSFNGVTKSCDLALVPEASEGDYVIVHAGFALNRIDEAEALQTLADVAAMHAEFDADS